MEHPSAQLPPACRLAIVGAGLAGLELARELERHGESDIVVLEAGPGDDRRHVNVALTAEEALRQWLVHSADPYFHRSWTSANPPHYAGPSGLRRRLGGRSLYWYGVTLPIEDWALREPWWPREVITDLRDTWLGGESLYQRLTSRLRRWAGAAPTPDETAGAVTVGGLAMRPTPRAVRRCASDPQRWYAYSPLDEWRDPETGAADRLPRGITWIPGAEVISPVVRDGACQGLLVRPSGESGPVTRLQAQTVVLAAGTLENSRLAIQALHQADPEAPTRLGGLADHIVQGVVTRLAGGPARRLLDAIGPGSYMASCGPSVRSNLFLDVRRLSDGDVLLDLKTMGEQEPSADSYVECSRRPRAPWPTTVHSLPSRRDQEMLAAQREVLTAGTRDLAAIAGYHPLRPIFADYAEPVRTNAVLLGKTVSALDPGVPVTWANSLGTEDHEGGTLPLGTTLTSGHEFKAVRGLYAIGPAVFPRMGAANPSLTALALAHRLAAVLAGKD